MPNPLSVGPLGPSLEGMHTSPQITLDCCPWPGRTWGHLPRTHTGKGLCGEAPGTCMWGLSGVGGAAQSFPASDPWP